MFGDNDVKLDYSDVLLVPRDSDLSSRSHVNLEVDHFDIPVVPIIAANMDGVGTFEMAKALGKYKMMTALVKHYSLEELVEFYEQEEQSKYAVYSMGIGEGDWDKFVAFDRRCYDNDIRHPIAVSIDVANGYTHSLDRFLSKMCEDYPDYIYIVGTVVTPERTETLIELGANIVKIGIGPGSVCTTRTTTGVGYPQFSAVLECASAAQAAGGAIIADGGITCPGDAAKAFAAGAKYVMIGGMFAGHEEGLVAREDNEVVFVDLDKPSKAIPFYGMASKEAQDKYNGGVADYRASEGKFVTVPYRGPVKGTIHQLLGGLRSACTYVGAESLEGMYHRSKFVKVNRQINNIFGI
jgi:GMP reductase